MLSNLTNKKIILGSASPRRKELLAGLDIDFDIVTKDVEESYPNHLSGVDIPIYLAEKKAIAFENEIDEHTLLITADTIVFHQGEVLGKPSSETDAKKMLQKLSGKTHQVITGVCIYSKNRKKVFHTISEVSFSILNNQEINYYIEKYKPYDKAGSYGVQEWIGFIAVEHINGSYYNVMGLPIQRLYNELKRWK